MNGVTFDEVSEILGTETKLIKVESIKKGEVVLIDPMTSFRIKKDTLSEVRYHCSKIEASLKGVGVNVIRTKIESDLTYPDEVSYYESHIQIKIPAEEEHVSMYHLSTLANYLGVHMSRNAFKKSKDSVTIMVTARTSDKDSIVLKTETSIDFLKTNGFLVSEKVEIESVVYDSKLHHDKPWISVE